MGGTALSNQDGARTEDGQPNQVEVGLGRTGGRIHKQMSPLRRSYQVEAGHRRTDGRHPLGRPYTVEVGRAPMYLGQQIVKQNTYLKFRQIL